MDDNIPVLQRGDILLTPVQTDLMKKFNEHPELFQAQINPSITQIIKETQRMYDNLPKTNPVVEELKAVKSELQTQTAKVDEVLEENAKLRAEVKSYKVINNDINGKLDKANEINQQQADEIATLRKQLNESTASKVGNKVLEITLSVIGGILLAFALYYIGKWLGISLS